MRILAFIVLSALATFSYAGCFIDITSTDIKLSVQKIPEGGIPNNNHAQQVIVKVSVLSKYDGADLDAMFLTKGEVSEFWYPIAFKIKDGIASTELHGAPDSIKNLEMAFYYSVQECTLSTQVLI